MAVLPAADITLPRDRAGGGAKRSCPARHPEVRAISAFTRVLRRGYGASLEGTTARASEQHPSRAASRPPGQGVDDDRASGRGRQGLSFSRKVRAHAEQRTPRKKRSPQDRLQTRREAERREAHQPEPHRQAMRRAPSLLSSHCGRTEAQDFSLGPQKMERARSPFGAPPRHPRFFRPRLGSGRASWNHRMQTGGPSPAPVQRAPRSPTRAGRDDAQAARERSVSLRPREPLPLRPKEYPRERRPFASGILVR